MLQAPVTASLTPFVDREPSVTSFALEERKSQFDDEFGRLVRIYLDGERLLGQWRRTNARLTRARDYLASEGCNVALGQALVDRLLDRKSWLLLRLRANRIAAQAVLGIPNMQSELAS